jgi:hypothetical protein
VSERVGYTVVRVLPDLEGKRWGETAEAYLRSLRPSRVRVIKAGEPMTSDAWLWRVTVQLTAGGLVHSIEQEVEVDLPPGIDHGHHLGRMLDGISR